MVIVEGLPLLQGEIVVGGIIIVVGKYADVIAKLLQQAVYQGGFPGAGAAGNANDEGSWFHLQIEWGPGPGKRTERTGAGVLCRGTVTCPPRFVR